MDGAFIWRLPWPAGTCIALHHLAGVCWHHEKLSVRPHHPSPHLGPRLTPANCMVWEEAQCDPASILWSNMWQGAQTEAQSGHWTPYVAFVIPLTDGRIVLTLLTSDIKNYYKLKTFYCRELQIFLSWKCRVKSRDNSNSDYVIQRKGEEFLSEIYRQPHHWGSGRDKEIIKTDFTSTIKRNV